MPDIFQARLLTLGQQSPSFAFNTEEGRSLALQAITHSSVSARINYGDLARVGELAAKAAAAERLFRAVGKRPTGGDYNDQLQLFTTSNLNRVGRRLGLERVILIGNGMTVVSDGMIADCLKALFGAVKLSQGQDALLELLDTLGLK